MGQTSDDKITRWMDAAGQSGKSASVRDRVVVAGEFLEKTARMNEADACDCLKGIDFSKPVRVLKLPPGVYVQYLQKHKGVWFTSTGLTPDLVGLAGGTRTRKLFAPAGDVFALESTARAIKDTWTANQLFDSIAPAAQGKLGQMTRGGGKQYVVADKSRMREL